MTEPGDLRKKGQISGKDWSLQALAYANTGSLEEVFKHLDSLMSVIDDTDPRTVDLLK